MLAANAGAALAHQFAAYLSAAQVPELNRDRAPSPLLSPSATIAAQMDALQRNDWPEPDAGISVAFLFALPAEAEKMVVGEASKGRRAGGVRSWGAKEAWLDAQDFSTLLHSPTYAPLLGCDSWKPAGRLVFPQTRVGERAVQAIEVRAPRLRPPQGAVDDGTAGSSAGDAEVEVAQRSLAQQWGQHAGSRAPWLWQGGDEQEEQQGEEAQLPVGATPRLRSYVFTFCLERVASGPLRDCWMTVGVRQGDYSC